jgi:hypothetical protein
MDRARKTRIECSFLVERASHEHQGVLKELKGRKFFASSLFVREKKPTSVDERGFRTDAGSRKAGKSDQGMPFLFTKNSCCTSVLSAKLRLTRLPMACRYRST